MANIKELIQSIESTDSSFDEKLEAINKMEETLVAMRQQEEKAVQDNVDLIVEAIKVMENKVTAQLEVAKSIVPEKGDKGDKGDKGADGRQGIDGKNGQDGRDGKDGIDGKDGVSVSNAQIDFDGSLVITLSTGQEINVGEVVAPELQERIKLVTSGGAGTVLPTQTGNANKYLKTDGSALSWAAGDGTGTVTSVGGTGTVSGISLSGTVTSSGNLTLGGTLDLSSPPTIGNTTPSTGTFTTLIGGGSSANYGQLTGGATTKAVEFQTLGSDSNIALVLDTKGTGAIDLAAGSSGVNISNGGTVTAITRTAAGSGYTSIPSLAISAPTTAGGVQAIATPSMLLVNATVQSGGTGYTVGDTLTVVGGTGSAVILTVSTVSSGVITAITINSGGFGNYSVLPTNPVSVTGGTGSSATFNLSSWGLSGTFNISNAGSGYVEQPTVTFSSGSATAYATVGTNAVVSSIGAALRFANAGGLGFQVGNAGTATVNYLSAQGSNAGNAVLLSASGSDSNIAVRFSSFGTSSVSVFTNNSAQEQLRVSHTASAVNYVQVTGAATGSNPIISSQGSDSNVGMTLTTKGTFGLTLKSSAGGNIFTATHGNSSTSNYLTFNATVSGSQPTISVANSVDADVDIVFTPKGAGAVRFGTYTASVLTPTGYITIKDSGGTSRRLLVG